MNKPVHIHAIRTLVPRHELSQEDILAFMKTTVDPQGHTSGFLDTIYRASAIQTRHTVLDDLGLLASSAMGTAERNEVYTRKAASASAAVAESLFRPASVQKEPLGVLAREYEGEWKAGPALGLSPVHPEGITHLITVSCTGFSAPGFDIAVQRSLGLDPGVKRIHVGFMGCCAAFPALRTARDICRSQPGAAVMVVLVEFCTLHFSTATDRDTLVANSLFSDGAAAILVSSREPGGESFELDEFATSLIDDGGENMAWTLGNQGFNMRLSAYVPRILGSSIQEIFARLEPPGKTRRGRARPSYAVHPGGRAILDKVGAALGLAGGGEAGTGLVPGRPGGLDPSYRILGRYGNMSAVTMAFVLAAQGADLEKAASSSKTGPGRPGRQPVLAAAFGPGLTVETARLAFTPAASRRGYRLRHGVPSARLPLVPAVKARSLSPELMDDPRVNPQSLSRTFRQFRRLNRFFSGYRAILRREVFERIQDAAAPGRIWRILDVGCGGGDILVWLAGEAQRRGVKLELVGMDPDPAALVQARQSCRGLPALSFREATLDDLVPGQDDFDFVISNHVLHHLGGRVLERTVELAFGCARVSPVLVDIRRGRFAYWSYGFLSRIVAPGSLAHYDGKLSVLRSFSKAELEAVLVRLGLDKVARVERRWPFRLAVLRPAEQE